MGRLIDYAETTDIMKMKVQYNKQTFSWDMFEELKIVETKLNSHVKGQTTSYAFLAMLHVKLKIKHRDQIKHVKRMKDGLMVKYKGKYKTVTEAEAFMYSNHKELKEQEDKALQIEELKDLLEVCVRAFEQRKDMLQSLSANVRKEK
jgi:hypothetical protein